MLHRRLAKLLLASEGRKSDTFFVLIYLRQLRSTPATFLDCLIGSIDLL